MKKESERKKLRMWTGDRNLSVEEGREETRNTGGGWRVRARLVNYVYAKVMKTKRGKK